MVLLVLGFVAAIPASILTFGMPVLFVVMANAHDDRLASQIPWGQLAETWAVSLAVAIVASGAGVSLLRRRRRLILFLRRFGNAEATRAVTTAAASNLGQTWRLATLDDFEIEAIGLPTPTRIAYTAATTVGGGLEFAVHRSGQVATKLFWPAVIALVAIPIVDFLTRPEARRTAVPKEYFAILERIAVDHRLPASLHPDLHLAFIVSLFTVVLVVVAFLAYLALLLASLVMIGPLSFARGAAGGLSAAERNKRIRIGGAVTVDVAAAMLTHASRGVFAPRLVVVTVPSPLWQSAVRRLAEVSTAVLVDVSMPTDSLLWEVETLSVLNAKLVVVGEYERVRRLAGLDGSVVPPGSREARLLPFLDGREILAYTTDRGGRLRFARELADAFETAAG